MIRRSSVALAALLLYPGCAMNTFERHLAEGRLADAASAFEADSSLHRSERALYRAALLHVTPGVDTYRPQVARDLLVQLLNLHPSSVHVESALRIIGLIDEVESVRANAAAREQYLETRRVRLEDELERLREEVTALESQLAAQGEEGEMLRAALERLQWNVRDRDEQLRSLREELDRLKAIDLRIDPRAAPNPPMRGR